MEPKKFFKIGLMFLIILAIPVGVYLATAPEATRYHIKAGRIEEALIFLMPAEAKLEIGQTADFSLKIDTGRETVGGVKILVNFDPYHLTFVGLTEQGPAFSKLTSKETLGQIILQGEGNLIGQGTVATLSFEATGRGETEVDVDSSSIVWDQNQKKNILRNVAGTKVMIE